MVRLLLDTHVVIWAAQQPGRIPAKVRERIESAETRFVSAASTYEVAYQARLGKLPKGEEILAAWPCLLTDLRLEEMALSVSEMADAGRLDWDHGDPFDRMLVAQARAGNLELVTKDKRIVGYDGAPTAPWR